MTDPTILLAQLDWLDMRETLLFGARLVVAVLAGLVGWFISDPVARTLYGLAFHRTIPKNGLLFLRTAFAGTLAALAFFFFPVGSGTGLGGFGGGPGNQGVDVKEQNKQDNNQDPKDSTEDEVRKLPIELVRSSEYQGEGKYYLIQGKEPPVDRNAVEDFLRQSGTQWNHLEIIVYANSVSSQHPCVLALKDLAEERGFTWSVPVKYREQIKS